MAVVVKGIARLEAYGATLLIRCGHYKQFAKGSRTLGSLVLRRVNQVPKLCHGSGEAQIGLGTEVKDDGSPLRRLIDREQHYVLTRLHYTSVLAVIVRM